MATALIKHTQGALIGDGEAIAGVPSVLVEVENSNNAGVASWRIDLVYTPPGGSVSAAVPLALNANDSTPYASYTPDAVPGCYRSVLKVYPEPNYGGDPDTDIRNFVLRDPVYGMVFPPYQALPPKLPVVGSGIAGSKPDELNLDGQPFGWDGDGTEGLLLDFMRSVVSGEIGDRSGFKEVKQGEFLPIKSGSLVLLEGRSTLNGHIRLDGHMRVIGRPRRPEVLPTITGAMELPGNCEAPLDPSAGPYTLLLKPVGTPGDSVTLYSLSDAVTPPVITVDGQGPLLGGQVSRQITTPREYLRLVRRKGHSWMVA
jgi:hypothetical protein